MSTEAELQPLVVSMSDVEVVPKDGTALGMKLSRTVTHADHGANLMGGVSWMEPGETSNVWSTEETPAEGSGPAHHVGPIHELFFLISGRLNVEWSGGTLEMHANDTLFLPPGYRFRVENPGEETAFLFYVETPPLG